MALLTELTLDAARDLVAPYGRDLASVEPLAAGSVNSNFRLTTASGEVLFARIYEEQDTAGARAELALLDELAAARVPTVRALSTDAGERLSEHCGKPFALYPWVEGHIRCQAAVTPADAARVGEALAAVHSATVTTIPEGRFGLSDIRARLDRIERETADFGADVAFIRQRLGHYEAQRDLALPRGLIHGDLFRDNVLWGGAGIVALLDFESASFGAYLYDLMVTVEAWCFTERFEPELCDALIGAYDRARPLTGGERAAFVTEGAIAALRFATTRITDYALRAAPGMPPVRDYGRFLSRLALLEAGEIRVP